MISRRPAGPTLRSGSLDSRVKNISETVAPNLEVRVLAGDYALLAAS